MGCAIFSLPLGVQAETQDRKTALRHGGALPREAESEGGRCKREGWFLLKIPRGDIDGVGEVK